MKKLILLLMTLTLFTNVSYASFPVKAKINEPDSSSSLTFFVIAILVSALGLFLIKENMTPSIIQIKNMKNGY